MGGPSHIVFRKHSFLSSTAMGLSAIVITIVLSGTGVLLYGVHLAGEKTERVITLAQDAVRGLPDLTAALPPALADMLDDRRRPDYCDRLTITAQLTSQPGLHDGMRTSIEVVNNGDEVVSLLGLRIIHVDEQGRLLSESQEWAATPFAADHEWRGPIMPGSRRYFVASRCCLPRLGPLDEARPQVEITELRVWNGPKNAPATDATTPSEATATTLAAADNDA